MKKGSAPARIAGAALLAAACAPQGSTETLERALAVLEPKSGSTVRGAAVFSELGSRVTLQLYVTDAPPGTHAVHLHDVGDCSAEDGSSAGGHWNPGGQPHGQWGSGEHHLGDIGNLEVGPDGTGTLRLTTDRWAVSGDGSTANDVVGRAVVVHSSADDFTSQPAGNAGARIACGVVRRLESGGSAPPIPPPSTTRTASARLWPRSGSAAYGQATFTQKGSKVELTLEVSNATPGLHGVHLHGIGDCTDPAALSSGGHWNVGDAGHGDPASGPHHTGDVGNIDIGPDGKGTLRFETTEWVVDAPLVNGMRAPNDVVGRAVVVHAGPDDLVSQPAGNAGGRIACGVVGLSSIPPPAVAVARIDPRSGSSMWGQATFRESAGRVMLQLDVANLAPGPHGVHIHEKGDCSSFDALSSGPHWNPTMSPHGHPDGGAHHHGDIGNIVVGPEGTGTLTFSSEEWQLIGQHSVLGRALVVHAGPDDLVSQPAGNAGGRIGCGVITLDNQQPRPPRVVTVDLEPKSATPTTGRMRVIETGDAVTIELDLRNVTPGLHGVHVHQNPDCSSADGQSAGPHWNPTNAPHGAPDGGAHHLGDLGNISIDDAGVGRLLIASPRWLLGDGGATQAPTLADGGVADRYPDGGWVRFDLIGHSIIVHAGPDDGVSQPAGDAGARIACGVIR